MPVSYNAPHARRDQIKYIPTQKKKEFQSTRPAWGATVTRSGLRRLRRHFNPRAPYGARPFAPPMVTPSYSLFQSTRPVWGATCCKRVSQIYDNNFNPRAPYGARQEAGYTQARIRAISIHAPHMGRDVRGCYTSGKDFYFNPRAPCGARQFILKTFAVGS